MYLDIILRVLIVEEIFKKKYMKKEERFYTEKQVDRLCELIRHNERQWDLFNKGIIKIKPKSYDELIIEFKTNKIMKQTAVEWLVENFKDNRFLSAFEEEINQAKEMEKQQIIDAFNNGYYQETIGYNASEKYYNKTFKNK